MDQSLRKARDVYVVVAVFLVPGALIAAIFLFFDIAALAAHVSGSPVDDPIALVWDVFWSVVVIFLARIVVSQALEARRRIRILADDPEANVRPIYVPGFFRNL